MKALKCLLPFLAATCWLPAFAGVPIPLGDVLLVPQSGDNTVLWLDPATGIARVGESVPAGTFSWGEPFDTGIAPITGVTGNVDIDGTDGWAITSDVANAVILLTADSLVPSMQTLSAIGIGPRLAANPDSGLMLIHTENGAPDPVNVQRVINLTDDPPAVLNALSLNAAHSPLQFLAMPGTSTAILLSQVGNSRQLKGLTPSGAMMQESPAVSVGGLMHIQTGVNDANSDPVVFLWNPGGSNNVGVYRWDGTGLTSVVANTLSFSAGLIQPVDATTVAVVAADGSAMIVASVNATGNFVVGETFFANPGERLFGLFRFGANHRVIFSGDAADSRPESFRYQQLSGTTWVDSVNGTAPELPIPGELGTNVFFFSADPFVTSGASMLGGARFADWSAKADPLVAMPPQVVESEFLGESSGLGNEQPESLSAPSGTGYVLTNQYRSGLSIGLAEGQSAVRRPALGVFPESGTYPRTIEVTADFDSRRSEAWLRFGSAGAWVPFPDQVLVAYTTEISVYVRDTVTGLSSPIVKRHYVIDAGELPDSDANGDGLPDFVRQAYGLDPLGPHDSSGNGISDFIEILLGHDPLNILDSPNPEDIPPYFSGFGLVMLGTALSPTGERFDHGHTLTARRMDNRLLARGTSMSGAVDSDADGVSDVEEILFGTDPQDADSVNPNGSVAPAFYAALDRVAPLRGAQTVSANNGLLLHSATGFDVNNGDPLGREVVALLPPPEPRRPEISPISITGNLQIDAEAWRLAALNAYASFRPEPDLVELTPESTLRAVAVEAMMWNVLASLDPSGTPGQDAFTAFAWRTADTGRTPVTRAELQLLSQEGYPLNRLIEGADAYFDSTPPAGLLTATEAVYLDHMNNSVGDARALPLDTLRRFFAASPDAASLEADLDGVLTPAEISAALVEAAVLTALASGLQRPFDTWTLVMSAHNSLAPNRYVRADSVEVELFHPGGRSFRIDQGIGLAPGTEFEVHGFTDITGPDGHPGMEVLAMAFTGVPLASNNDADGNLLDDEWEEFYFGTTGLDPFEVPSGKSHTLLQFFLEGLDPRGTLNPSGPTLPTAMPAIGLAASAGGGTITFPWPAGYDDQFEYIVETTEDLTIAFAPDFSLSAVRVGNEIEVVIPPAVSPAMFYRLRLQLTP
jgi:hypothetical protein